MTFSLPSLGDWIMVQNGSCTSENKEDATVYVQTQIMLLLLLFLLLLTVYFNLKYNLKVIQVKQTN